MGIETPWDEQDARERVTVAAMPEGERPHYELNDGTCVSCGQPWMCQGYIDSLALQES